MTNKIRRNIGAIYGYEPWGWSPVYVRCLASFDRALKKATELGFHKISLVYGFHIRQSILKSKQYLAALVRYAQSKGFEVEMVTGAELTSGGWGRHVSANLRASIVAVSTLNFATKK